MTGRSRVKIVDLITILKKIASLEPIFEPTHNLNILPVELQRIPVELNRCNEGLIARRVHAGGQQENS
jgi:hypothetical protein